MHRRSKRDAFGSIPHMWTGDAFSWKISLPCGHKCIAWRVKSSSSPIWAPGNKKSKASGGVCSLNLLNIAGREAEIGLLCLANMASVPNMCWGSASDLDPIWWLECSSPGTRGAKGTGPWLDQPEWTGMGSGQGLGSAVGCRPQMSWWILAGSRLAQDMGWW